MALFNIGVLIMFDDFTQSLKALTKAVKLALANKSLESTLQCHELESFKRDFACLKKDVRRVINRHNNQCMSFRDAEIIDLVFLDCKKYLLPLDLAQKLNDAHQDFLEIKPILDKGAVIFDLIVLLNTVYNELRKGAVNENMFFESFGFYLSPEHKGFDEKLYLKFLWELSYETLFDKCYCDSFSPEFVFWAKAVLKWPVKQA